MKRIPFMTVGVIAAVVAGCAGVTEVARMSRSSRSDVFAVTPPGTQPPRGHARLRISATLKTHAPGAHAAVDLHGTPEHVLLLNIDGQVIELRGSPRQETRESLAARDPEAGEGTRYRFETTLDVREGKRRVTAVVPADEVVAGRDVDFVAGKSVSIVLEPVYGSGPGWARPGEARTGGYRQGLLALRFVVDGDGVP